MTNRGIAQKLLRATQQAYVEVAMARYEQERAKAVTEPEIEALRIRWTNIIHQLEDGYILDLEAL